MDLQPLLILYGSQTGTAFDVAEQISRNCTRHHVPSRVVAMDDYHIQELVLEPIVLFVCSTTGQGDEPDNMKKFWRFLLKKSLPRDSLQALSIGVFGLGDSSYPQFNFVAKRLNKRLQQLGARPILQMGLADDQHPLGVDGALDPWLKAFLLEYEVRYPPKEPVIPVDSLLPPKLNIITVVAGDDDGPTTICDSSYWATCQQEQRYNVAFVPMTANTRMTSAVHFQDVRHVTFDIKESGLCYQPGDVCNILPQNIESVAEEICDWCGWDLDCNVLVEAGDNSTEIPRFFLNNTGSPRVLKVRTILMWYLNIGGVPRRYFFELLSHFATDMEKEKLQEFASAAGQEDLYAYCHRMKRTCIEVLRDFPTTKGKIPMTYMLDLFTPLQPRAFSISSCQEVDQNELHLTIAIVEYKTRMATPRKGVFTSWLAENHQATAVPMYISPGTFKFPETTVPVILVGPGTGCAPFRSLIRQRVATTAARAETVMIFGNRKRNYDALYCSEWKELEDQGKLVLLTAFSRDQENKIYVQHRIRENGKFLWELIDMKGALVFVAGNANQMPKDVKEAFVNITQQHGGLSEESAQTFWNRMEKTKRLQFETWA